MSSAERIALSRGQALAEHLVTAWAGGDQSLLWIVGSVRRERSEIGDVDLVARLPEACRRGVRFEEDDRDVHAEDDALFRAMNETVVNPVVNEREALFAPPPEPRRIGRRHFARAVQGFRPGFRAAKLEVRLQDGSEIPVQVFRSPPEALGWTTLYRTGPAEYSEWALGQWKRAQAIPTGDPRYQGSVRGHLVDRLGVVVPVREEIDVYRAARLEWVEPRDRDRWIEAKLRRIS